VTPSGPGPGWDKLKARILSRDHRRCHGCGTGAGLTAHHILPRLEGGTDNPANLITLCNRCHDLVEAAWERLQSPEAIRSFIRDQMIPWQGKTSQGPVLSVRRPVSYESMEFIRGPFPSAEEQAQAKRVRLKPVVRRAPTSVPRRPDRPSGLRILSSLTCPGCGADFLPRRPNQIHCQTACRFRAWDAQNPRIRQAKNAPVATAGTGSVESDA
jgi:hypothetical protein